MGIIFAPHFVPKSRASKAAFTPYLPNSLYYIGKFGRSGGIRTPDPFTLSEGQTEIGRKYSQLELGADG